MNGIRLSGHLVGLHLLFTVVASAAPAADHGKIEILRDQWGIPHVFSETDAGALYGLGYFTAEERGFQMTYGLRIIQGRLAEVIGERPRGQRRETSVDNDRKMRTFGWARAAGRTARNLDAPTRTLLDAYCHGVNDSFADQAATKRLHPLFKELGVNPEPWTPADCLLSWWHIGQFFATDGTRDLIGWRNSVNPPPGRPRPPERQPGWADDATSVVRKSDVSRKWLDQVNAFAAGHGLAMPGPGDDETPKFSHAWVVGGKRTTTGAAVLVSDPQTPVRNPSLWIEFHVSGKTFNARGVGVPGSPGLLIGFNEKVAWGLTALGADQADLFRLQTDPDHPNQYKWNNEWRAMAVRTERIRVKDGDDVRLTVRETHLGPLVSGFSFRRPGDPEVALKRIPLCEPERDTIQAVIAMMRASNAGEFGEAARDWRFPSANCLYGDDDGHIGYAVLGAIPVRAATAPDPNGRQAMPGTGDQDDWRGFVPAELVPQVFDPPSSVLFSGNHRPVAGFYPIPLGLGTGGMGDSIRSWRLRELLTGRNQFTPKDVLQVHFDTVNPARREIVRLGLHLRDTRQGLSREALDALEKLEPWYRAGASSDLTREGADLATRISTFFRMMATPVALRYGGGESGLARFLKDASARMHANTKAVFDADEKAFVDAVLSAAWQNGGGRARRGSPGPGTQPRLAWFDSLDGFGSLLPDEDLPRAPIQCQDGQTIHCQAAQSYTQWVPLHDVDAAMSICPIGHSDRAQSPFRQSTMVLWGEAGLHPAPITRDAVEKLPQTRVIKSWTPERP
jgi:penicillin amidase